MARASRHGWRAGAAAALIAAALALAQTAAWGHAFLSRSDPRAGATVGRSPERVRVWFDGPVEPFFVVLRVENRERRRMDSGDGRVNPEDPRLLEVGVPPLPRGSYRVVWSVIARDGHRKEGEFPFRVR